MNDQTTPAQESSTQERMAYIGRASCGCIRMATVDDPAHARDTAREIAKAVRAGEAVERVTCQYVREATWTVPGCTAHDKKAKTAAKPASQAGLL